jgi:hypothetical protein
VQKAMINNLILKLAAGQHKINSIKHIEQLKLVLLSIMLLIIFFGGIQYGFNHMSVYK